MPFSRTLLSLSLGLCLLLAPASADAATISYVARTTYSSGGASVGSFQLAKPAGTLVTDVLVVQITAKATTGFTITPPDASWRSVLATYNGASPCQFVFFKIATDTEPASYTFTASASRVIVAGLSTYRGAWNDPSSLVNVSGAQTQGSQNGVITSPSITTTTANTMLLAFFAGANNGTITANAPLTGHYAVSGGSNDANGAGYQPLTAAGATGTRTAKVTRAGSTKLTGSGNAIGQLVALAPSPLDHFVIERVGGGALAAQTQRSPFTVQLRAVDASGNTVTSYGGKVTVTATGTLSAGGGTTGTFTSGVLTPWTMGFSDFGSFTITVADYTQPAIRGTATVTVNPVLDHFTVEASGGGTIPNQTTGTPFTIRITARDSVNGVFTPFTGTVAVTSTGTLSAGGGTTPGFVGGVLTRSVTLASAGSWTLTATRSAGTESGTSNVFVVGAVGDFNVMESSLPAGSVNGYIGTKIAGVPFALDVVAVNTSNDTVNTGFNDAVKIEVLGSTRTGIAVGTDNCPTSAADYTVLQTVSPATVANGRSTVGFAAVANVWRESRIRVTYPAAGPPTAVACSDDIFAIRPDHLTITATDADWSAPGTARSLDNTGPSGGVVHRAGRPFTVTVTAYDGAATPATTSNYTVDYAPSPTPKSLACQLPAGCVTGTFAPGTWLVAGPGVVGSTTATYDEVGTVALALQDVVFASVDAGDPVTPANHPIPQGGGPTVLGRFVPDHFAIAATRAPVLRTFGTSDGACSTPIPPDAARAFTYIGQPFGYATTPQLQVTAQNAADGTTANYGGVLWKIDPAADVSQTYANTPIPPATPPPLTTQVHAPIATPTGGGRGTITVDAADVLAFTRAPLPQAAFTAAISLTVNVQDSSESPVSGNGIVASTGALSFAGSTGDGIDFDSGDLFVHGRLAFTQPPPTGPASAPLNIPLQVEWYDVDAAPAQYVVSDDDYCTTYGAGNVSLGSWTGALVAGDTTASGSGVMVQGQMDPSRPLALGAPKSAHSGAVTVTHAAPAWLLQGGTNPSVVATFLQPTGVAASFAAASILPGGVVRLTVTLTNPNGIAITGAAFADAYPAGLVNAAAAVGATTCTGGVVTAANGGNSLSLSGASVPPNGSCSVTVNVSSASAGSYTNSTGAVTTANAGTAAAASATLVVMAPPAVTMSFSPASVKLGTGSTVTITIGNPNPLAITGAAFTDGLPTVAGGKMTLASPSNLATSASCGVLATTVGNDQVKLSGATVPASGGTCTVSFDVTVSKEATYTNGTGPVSSGNAGTGAAGVASLTVTLLAPPTVAASVTPASVLVNVGAQLTIILTNVNDLAITDAAFTSPHPAGLVNAASPGAATTCPGGAVTAAAGGGAVALAGATIPAHQSCTITVRIAGTTAGTYTSSTGLVSTFNAGFGASASATLVVVALPSVLITASADRSAADPGNVVTYTLQVTNAGGPATTVIIAGAMGPYQALGLGSFGPDVSLLFIDGSPASGLAPAAPSYSNDGGASYGYTPASGAGGAPAGHDGAVTNWALPLTGTMNANSSFTVQYRAIVR